MARIITGKLPGVKKMGYSYAVSNLELPEIYNIEAQVRKSASIPVEATCRKAAEPRWDSTVLDFVWFEVAFDG